MTRTAEHDDVDVILEPAEVMYLGLAIGSSGSASLGAVAGAVERGAPPVAVSVSARPAALGCRPFPRHLELARVRLAAAAADGRLRAAGLGTDGQPTAGQRQGCLPAPGDPLPLVAPLPPVVDDPWLRARAGLASTPPSQCCGLTTKEQENPLVGFSFKGAGLPELLREEPAVLDGVACQVPPPSCP